MDAVISIGGQSFLDGLMRLLGPALQPLRAPMPVALPGVANGVLSMRDIRPVLPGRTPGLIELQVELDLAGEVLLQLPAGAGDLTPPHPAVVPVAVDFTRTGSLLARIFLAPSVNGAGPNDAAVPIDGATGFGLDFRFRVVAVQLAPLAATFATTLQGDIAAAFATVTGQLLQGLTPAVQPAAYVLGVATGMATGVPAAVQSALVDAFSGLRARTGRLIYPAPAPGSSCDIRALPTAGQVQMVIAADGSVLLQVGFDRASIPPTARFPAFTPAGAVDTRVTLENAFVRDLLVCLVEKFPNLSLPPLPPSLANTAGIRGATWAPVTLTVGPLALGGRLDLAIAGRPAAPGTPTVPKAVSLTFDLGEMINVPWVIGSAFDIRMTFTLPIAFDLGRLAPITALRVSGGVTIPAFAFGPGRGLTITLALVGAMFLLPAFVGVYPIIMPGLAMIALLIGVGPHIVTGIIGSALRNAIHQVLGVVHQLESPAALPRGILEAFGALVPTTMMIDNLVADGVLETPTSPWTALPILSNLPVPPAGGGGDPPG